jgi:hypothetical protein
MLDGSFLENVELTESRDPGDIDVFSLLAIPPIYSDKALWVSKGLPFWRSEIADQAKNKARFKLDTYALSLPLTNVSSLRALMYWHGLFGHQRVTFAWKGFVMVPLDRVADATALGAL